MRFRNLTPHTIAISPKDGETLTIEPDGFVARCQTIRADRTQIKTEAGDAIECVTVDYGHAELPAQCDGTGLIVSILVAQQSNRGDLFIVDEEIRNQQGQIIGCRRLAQLRG
jgi:hypothetical protein